MNSVTGSGGGADPFESVMAASSQERKELERGVKSQNEESMLLLLSGFEEAMKEMAFLEARLANLESQSRLSQVTHSVALESLKESIETSKQMLTESNRHLEQGIKRANEEASRLGRKVESLKNDQNSLEASSARTAEKIKEEIFISSISVSNYASFIRNFK